MQKIFIDTPHRYPRVVIIVGKFESTVSVWCASYGFERNIPNQQVRKVILASVQNAELNLIGEAPLFLHDVIVAQLPPVFGTGW